LQDAEREFATAVRLDPTNVHAAQRLRDLRQQLGASGGPPK
jgi:hypothetical protein